MEAREKKEDGGREGEGEGKAIKTIAASFFFHLPRDCCFIEKEETKEEKKKKKKENGGKIG